MRRIREKQFSPIPLVSKNDIIWVALIPLGNLLIITLKPEKMNISKRKKLTVLSLGIGLNIIFGVLFAIFELTSPDFLVYISYPNRSRPPIGRPSHRHRKR